MHFLKTIGLSRRGMASSSVIVKRLDFLYDVGSPYSWFSFEVLMRYKKFWKIDLHLQPVLLGGIFRDSNNAGPASTSPAKAQHMSDDIKRCGIYFDVPIKPMQDFPELVEKGTLRPMRFLTATKAICPQHLENASRKFWMIRWHQDVDFTTNEALKSVVEACGMSEEEAKSVLEKMMSDEIKLELRRNTTQAVECGVFGIPTVIVHDSEGQKLFFGSDRFPILAQELKEEWRGPHPEKCSKL